MFQWYDSKYNEIERNVISLDNIDSKPIDLLNLHLHVKSRSPSRGGIGTRHDFLNKNDFAMTFILQSVSRLFDEWQMVQKPTQDVYFTW